MTDDNSKSQENNENEKISIENTNNLGQFNDSNLTSNNIQEPLLNNENIKIYPNPNEISSSNIENKTNQQNNFFVPPPIINNDYNQNIIPNNIYQPKEINQNRNDNVIQNGIVYKDPYTNSQMKYQVNSKQNIPLRVQQRKRPWGMKDFFAILVGFALGVGTIGLFYLF